MPPYKDRRTATAAKKVCMAKSRQKNLSLLERLEKCVVALEDMAEELDSYRLTYAQPEVSIPPTARTVTPSCACKNGAPLTDDRVTFQKIKGLLTKFLERTAPGTAARVRMARTPREIEGILNSEDAQVRDGGE